MAEVVKYSVNFNGGATGSMGARAYICLSDAAGKTLGYINFADPNMSLKTDYESTAGIQMHLPSAMFESVVDVLRNEKPICLTFSDNCAKLYTVRENIGEGETP